MKHIMIDIECIGPTIGRGKTNREMAQSVILSIGAVAFDINDPIGDNANQYYINIDIDSNLREGRLIGGDTIRWWFNQDDKAIKALTSPPILTLGNALKELSKWMGNYEFERIWANGTTFDLMILRDAYECIHMAVPWRFRQESCMRAIRALGQHIGIDYSDFIKKSTSVKHNALDDAIVQAEYVQEVFKSCSNSAVESLSDTQVVGGANPPCTTIKTSPDFTVESINLDE